MMIDLQNYYEANNNLSLESVSEGKLYAGKFRNDWYRYVICVTHTIKEVITVNNNVLFTLEYTLLILSAIMKYLYISATMAM